MSELTKIFLSVGRTRDKAQEQFIAAIEARLEAEGMKPCTVGRNFFKNKAPLESVSELMKECSGAVIIALERLHFPEGVERRGHPECKHLADVKLPTIWNQTEAAMAYVNELPILLIAEHGLRIEGFLENGYQWSVHWVDVSTAALTSQEFNGIFADWKKQVILVPKHGSRTPEFEDIEALTVKQFLSALGRLSLPKIWGLLSSIFAVLATIASVAYRIGAGQWPWK